MATRFHYALKKHNLSGTLLSKWFHSIMITISNYSVSKQLLKKPHTNLFDNRNWYY